MFYISMLGFGIRFRLVEITLHQTLLRLSNWWGTAHSMMHSGRTSQWESILNVMQQFGVFHPVILTGMFHECSCLVLYSYRNKCTRWRSSLRHFATSREVTGSIPNGVTGIFHWHNPYDRPMALGLTQPLTEMSTRNISWG